MTTVATVTAGAGADTVVNQNFEALSAAGMYGRRAPATAGLTWAYYGGRGFGNTIADGTVTLTASTTNYVVANRSTGAVTVATSTTNWNNATDYYRVRLIVTGAATITTETDYRELVGGGAGGGGTANPMTTVGDIIVGGTVTSGVAAPARLGLGSALQVLRVNGAGTALEYAAPSGTSSQCIPIACSDETTALTAGTAKVTFRMPFAMTGVTVKASLTTAQASGSIFTVDVNEAGVSILSTKLTIDNTEKTSATAATPPVVSDTALANDAEITIDIDQIGDGTAKGLKVYLLGTV